MTRFVASWTSHDLRHHCDLERQTILDACLRAVTAQLHPDDEIIVVDNGSIDGTAVWLRHAWSAVRLVALPANLGFAGGVNAGLRAARGDLLLLLNNDAFVEPGCVPALVEALRITRALARLLAC